MRGRVADMMRSRVRRVAGAFVAIALLGSARPVTPGTQLSVVMRGQRFFPARVEATVGDTVRFEMESGGPHNIAFDPDSIPAGALAALARNMGSDPRFLVMPEMLIMRGEAYTLPLAGLPPGTYPFFCTPHLGNGMRGELIVRAR